MRIVGVILPEGTPNPEDPVDLFTPEEMRDMDIRGKPIWVDHKKGTEIGEIVSDWIGTDGLKYVVGDLRGDTSYEQLTQSRILTGALPDFSLTHQFDLFENRKTGELIHQKTPVEVSVVREARRAKCRILAAYPDSGKFSRKTKNLYNKSPGQSSISHTRRITMSSNTTTEPTVTVPAIPEPQKGFDDLDKEKLLQEAINDRKARVEMEVRLAQMQAQNQEYQQRLAQEQDVRRNAINAELDAILDASLKAMNQEKTVETVKILEPLRKCSDLESLQTTRMLLSGLVSANVQKEAAIVELQNQLRQTKQNALAQAYYGMGTPTKFAAPETRFAQPPEPKLPQQVVQAQAAPFFPQQTQTQTPVAPQGVTPFFQTAQAQPRAVPVIYPQNAWTQTFNPFIQRATAQVSAGINYQPGNFESLAAQPTPMHVEQPKGFSIDQMAMFAEPTSGHTARGVSNDSYAEIHKHLPQQRSNGF